MLLQSISYLLPDGLGLDGLRQQLAELNVFQDEAVTLVEQTYFDSFDWRVWQAQGLLLQECNHSSRLCWIDRETGAELESEATGDAPGFSGDLPPGPLRDRLTPVLEMRVLMPLVHITLRRHTLRQLDDEEKTLVRLVLQGNRFASFDGKRGGALDDRLMLLPLKGYEGEFKALCEQLEARDLVVAERSLFEDALAGIGRRPGDYSSKISTLLDPDARADATAKKILLGLLDTLAANIAGARGNLDSEFLHDLRVATRRTRSAMTQIKGVFEPKELAPFKKGFGWIGKITGPTRDLDVYLLQFPVYRSSLPAAMQADLDPFLDFLVKHQRQAQRDLVKKLNSPHFHKLIKSWRQWLNKPVPDKPKAPNALRPIAELSDQRIHKLYTKVLRDGGAITPDSPPGQLHELRKECKKLRYLMEFFQSLYPKPEIRSLIKEVKILLDNLGQFQDLQVQADSLEAFGKQMMQEGVPAATLMAMGILVGQLLEQQAKARHEFAQLFSVFDSEENRRVLQKLFGR